MSTQVDIVAERPQARFHSPAMFDYERSRRHRVELIATRRVSMTPLPPTATASKLGLR